MNWFNLIETGRTLIENDLLFNGIERKLLNLLNNNLNGLLVLILLKLQTVDKVTGVTDVSSHMWNDKDYLVTKLENKKTLNEVLFRVLLENFTRLPVHGSIVA